MGGNRYYKSKPFLLMLKRLSNRGKGGGLRRMTRTGAEARSRSGNYYNRLSISRCYEKRTEEEEEG